MANEFRASTQIPVNGYKEALDIANDLKRAVTARAARMLAGPVTYSEIKALHQFVSNAIDRLTAIKSIDGIGQYAKDQWNDQNYDVAAAFDQMLLLLAAINTQIETSLPNDGTWLAGERFLNGKVVDRTFSTVATADLRATMTAFVATVV